MRASPLQTLSMYPVALSGVLNGVLSGVGMANDGQAEVDEDGDCNRRDVDVAAIPPPLLECTSQISLCSRVQQNALSTTRAVSKWHAYYQSPTPQSYHLLCAHSHTLYSTPALPYECCSQEQQSVIANKLEDVISVTFHQQQECSPKKQIGKLIRKFVFEKGVNHSIMSIGEVGVSAFKRVEGVRGAHEFRIQTASTDTWRRFEILLGWRMF